MTTPTVPDLLRRFVPTPHHGEVRMPWGWILVESNILTIARAVARRLSEEVANTRLQRIEVLKIVVDSLVVADGEVTSSIGSGPLRIVLRGTNTILFCDSGTRELLAFLAPEVTVAEFMERLLPIALTKDGPNEYFGMGSLELQTDDMDSIAP